MSQSSLPTSMFLPGNSKVSERRVGERTRFRQLNSFSEDFRFIFILLFASSYLLLQLISASETQLISVRRKEYFGLRISEVLIMLHRHVLAPNQLYLMMLSKKGGENTNEDSSDLKLLDEIDAIRKALHLDIKTYMNSGSCTKSNLKSFNEEKWQQEKKSLWSKTLMAFFHVRHRRFDCCFTLQVHSIEGLPPVFNDVSLCVHWKKRDRALVTKPAKVYQRTAEFEEELLYTCSVYGGRNGSHHSAKYEAKQFLLYASVYGEPELDLGKHRVDLTRLLPLTLEELEEEKSSGKWTTSYKLSGMGNGARLNISFGYSVTTNSSGGHRNHQNIGETFNKRQHNRDIGRDGMKFDQSDGKSFIRRTENLPSEGSQQSVALSPSVEDIKDLSEVLPASSLQELPISLDVLSEKLDEDKLVTSVDYKSEHDSLVEHVDPIKQKLFPLCDREKENCGINGVEFQVSDDDVVASESLNMLEIEHSSFSLTSENESDSPRERSLRKFEKEALADGCSLCNSDIFGGDQSGLDSLGASNSGLDSLADDLDLSSAVLTAEEEHQMEIISENSKTNAKQLENQETTNELNEEEASEEKAILQSRITEAHIAGVETKPSKQLWGSSHQQNSGSRWLIPNRTGKNDKHPFMKSKGSSKIYF